MKRKLTVYLPSGEVKNFETDLEVENIYLLNSNAVSVYFKTTSETVFVNMPFIYGEDPEPKA